MIFSEKSLSQAEKENLNLTKRSKEIGEKIIINNNLNLIKSGKKKGEKIIINNNLNLTTSGQKNGGWGNNNKQ